jgi:hypothetical protein
LGTMIVRYRVRDYFDWRRVFDYCAGLRKTYGLSNERVYRATHDGNDLVIVMEAESITKAKLYAESRIRREALRKADVIGEPVDCFIDNQVATPEPQRVAIG